MLKPKAHLLHLAPYQLPDTSSPDGVKVLQLAQNENYTHASEHALAAVRNSCDASRCYPPADARPLRCAIAKLHGLDPDHVICGRGAMELISLLATAYLEPGTSAITSKYGYLFFKTAIQLAGAEVLIAPEPKLVISSDAIAKTVMDTTRIVFVANPGNPTGSYLPKRDLIKLRNAIPDSVMLVIDEAYAEYVSPEHFLPCFDLTEQSNTVVLRTFSKIYGLAGMRVGWGYFPSDVANILYTIHQPSAVTGPSQAAAIAAIVDQKHVDTLRLQTNNTRDAFIKSLMGLGLKPLPAYGNFVLVRFNSVTAAADAEKQLRADAIIVRPMNNYDLSDCLRITIGTEEQMKEVIDSLGRWTMTQ